LYIDGFHITGWANSSDIGTGKCDSRDETVYTSDYRNKGIPQNKLWRLPSNPPVSEQGIRAVDNSSDTDPNDRGRGRAVETQSGGLAVMRCLAQAEEVS
jgi:hypothetical protein